MAKGNGEFVQVPREEWEQLTASVAELRRERAAEREKEDSLHPRQVYDEAWERRQAAMNRTPQERTQEIADRQYGTAGARWQCRLDSTREDGKAGPDIREYFPLIVSANSDLEAQARYLHLMGITKHDYRVQVQRVDSPEPAIA